MNTRKYLLISSAIALFLGGAFWFLSNDKFASETIVVESPLKIDAVNLKNQEETRYSRDQSFGVLLYKG